ncbi:MAG TPA: O-antigen ligase family protein [Gemmatimonadales bacterium]|nr:O-antigen ligase family protein [Gemmatimonadales bacterium]
MIGFLATLAGLLYCFVWLRPPEIAGIVLPAQRVLGWAALGVFLSRLVLKGSLLAGPAARRFLRAVLIFCVFLLLMLIRQLAYGENFFPLYFVMDLSKYAAAFGMAYLCYYALTAGLISRHRITSGIIVSGALATLLVYALLGLYYAGFRTETELIAPSFGGALGVWPTGGTLPRLAGPTAEPQQLSVVLVTPLLLMLSPRHVRRLWPLAILTASALLLSQSKFAPISLLVAGLYLILVYRRARWPIALAALAVTPVLGLVLIRLPTVSETLQAGLSAGAFVERLENLVLLLAIIREHPLFGIGAGHYGVYRGQTLYGDWRYEPGYTPNMDFLKVFAETGIFGFVLVLFLLALLVRMFARGYRRADSEIRPTYLAFFLGALGILLNMTIGYELLHAFFWINVGVLLYMVERQTGDDRYRPAALEREPATLGRA